MSRHKRRSTRQIELLPFLGNFIVASKRDIRQRRKMKHLGYVVDDREGVKLPIPTREELVSRLEQRGYTGIILTDIKRGSYTGSRLNPHQNFSVHYEGQIHALKNTRPIDLDTPKRYFAATG